MIDHVALLLLMSVAAAGIIAMAFRATPRAFAVALIWLGGCAVPLILMQAARIPDPLRLSASIDFAGAASLHLSAFLYVTAARWASARRAARPGTRLTPGRRIASADVILVAAWCAWVIALEGRVTPYTAGLVVNVLLFAIAGLVGGALFAAVRQRRSLDPRVALLASLGAASAAVSGMTPVAAASVGFVAGVVSQAISRRRRGSPPELWLRSLGIGALIGLLAVGLLDVRSGFFFTGQPTAVIGQVLLVTAAAVLAAVLGAVGGFVARGDRSRAIAPSE